MGDYCCDIYSLAYGRNNARIGSIAPFVCKFPPIFANAFILVVN